MASTRNAHTGGVSPIATHPPNWSDPGYRIRPATMADSPGIRAIRNAAMRDSLAIWTQHEHSITEAEDWLLPLVHRGTALVAVHGEGDGEGTPTSMDDGAVIGFAVASPWHHYEGYARTVEDSIYLTPATQGRGLGGRLLAELIRASRRAGDRTMVAAIESGNTASVHLHERCGFAVIGTIPQAGEKLGQVLDLTLMSRSLT